MAIVGKAVVLPENLGAGIEWNADKKQFEVQIPAPKDTGWYDITSLTNPPADAVVQGKLFLRRIDNVVYLGMRAYGWGAAKSAQKFFPDALCAYTAPLWIHGDEIRCGGMFMADNRNTVSFFYDWLGLTNFRMVSANGYTSFGLSQWVTDTPFPDTPLGRKIG